MSLDNFEVKNKKILGHLKISSSSSTLIETAAPEKFWNHLDSPTFYLIIKLFNVFIFIKAALLTHTYTKKRNNIDYKY